MALNYSPAYMTPKPEKNPYTPAPAESLLADIPKSYEGFSQSPTKVVQAPINRPVITPAKEPTKAAAWDFGPQSFVDNGKEGTAAKLAADAAAGNKPTLGEKGLTVAEQMDIADKTMGWGKYAPSAARPVITPAVPTFGEKDEAKIREEELARQRARIDAVNQLYVDEYRKAKERATARTGTQRAQSAARGTIGSDFGTAEQQAVTDINVSEEQAIRAKQEAEIQAIMNESDKSIQDRVAKAQALILAQQERADKLKQEQDQLAIQTGQLDLQKEKAKQDAIAAGIKPVETFDGNIINAITGEVIYKGKPKAQGPIELSPGATLYDPMTGKPLYTAPERASAGDQKIVKIGGIDYVQQADGSFTLPNVPTTSTASKLDRTDEVLGMIRSLSSMPGLGSAVGPISSKLPTLREDTAAFESQLDKLVTNLALENLSLLKGPMSDKDIAFIKDSVSALKTTNSEAGFRKELVGLETKFAEIKDKALRDAYDKVRQEKGITESYDEAKRKVGPDKLEETIKKLSLTNDLSTSQNGSVQKIASAIGQFESGGNYKAIGPDTGRGDKALGKYQIMASNLPNWSKEALGRVVTPQEFLNDPQIQDKIAEYKMGQYYNKYGNVQDVASVWFSGRPVSKAGNAKDVIGTSVPTYVKNVEAIYNRLS